MQPDDRYRESHHEVVRALLRSEVSRSETRPSDLIELAAIVCIGAGIVLDGVAVSIALAVVGAAALWLSFHRDDSALERGVGDRFDALTGLPLAQGLETVMRDELVAGSLSGRFAVMSIEIPQIAARQAAGDSAAARDLVVAIVHRLQTHGLIGDTSDPFGPLIFLQRPAVLFVVLRDVIDDRTTRWLAGHMLDIVNRPVVVGDESLDPGAVVGLALGNAADRADLVRFAEVARHRARRDGRGTVVSNSEPSHSAAADSWLVSIADESAVGRLVEPVPAGGEMFAEAAALLRALDEALEHAAATEERCFVRARGAALCHWDTPARIAARVNAVGLHGRVGIVVPSELGDRASRVVGENVAQIRRCGLDLYVDRSDLSAPSSGAVSGKVIALASGAEPDPDHMWAKRPNVSAKSSPIPQLLVTSDR